MTTKKMLSMSKAIAKDKPSWTPKYLVRNFWGVGPLAEEYAYSENEAFKIAKKLLKQTTKIEITKL